MVKIGKINRLSIKEIQSETIQLDGGESGNILLMDRNPSPNYNAGDKLDVFVYVDRQQRLLATTQKPQAIVGEVARLKVVDATEAGAFLQWGLDDDLFVPKSEQQEDMKEGKSYVVFVFLSEKSNRITGSSKIEKYLNKETPEYEEGEEVDIIIYARSELGYSAVIDNLYTGVIYENEVFQKIEIGRQQKGYIKKIREDFKIDLRLQQAGYGGVDNVCRTILKKIDKCGGTVPVTDKSRPEDIYNLFGVSKKVFKKAIGALYKKQLIILDTDSIKIREKNR